MKEINGYLLVEVPEGMDSFSFVDEIEWPRARYYKHYQLHGHVELPKGNYSIIGLAKDLTEEQWNNMVDNNQLGCFDNYRGKSDERYTCQTATESGHSLLKANNLNPDNCLILKKIL